MVLVGRVEGVGGRDGAVGFGFEQLGLALNVPEPALDGVVGGAFAEVFGYFAVVGLLGGWMG